MLPPVDFLRCSEVLDRLEEWMDGDLGPGEMVAVEDHLNECRECARELQLAREIRKELSGLPAFIPAPDMADAAIVAAQREQSDAVILHRWGRTARPVQFFAAAAAVIFAVVVVGPWEPASQTYTEEEVQQAVDQTKLALGYIGSITRRVDSQVRSRVLEDRAVSATIQGISQSLKWAGGSSSEKSETPLRD